MSDRVTEAPRMTPTHSSVSATGTATTLFTADRDKMYVTILNAGSTDLHVLLGAVADVGTVTATTPKTCTLEPGQYYEPQFPFCGTIQGIWDGSPTGTAEISTVAE